MESELLAPRAESYAPEPTFEYAATQREDEFAQLVAAGADSVEAMLAVQLVNPSEAESLSKISLYRRSSAFIGTNAVAERIAYYNQLHKMSLSATVERLQQEAACVAFADFAGVYYESDSAETERVYVGDNEDGEPLYEDRPLHRRGDPIRNPHDIPRHLRAAIKEYKIDQHGVVQVKFHDKLKGMQMIGDLGGHFNEANKAKAPQVNITLGGDPPPRTVDVTPTPAHDPLS